MRFAFFNFGTILRSAQVSLLIVHWRPYVISWLDPGVVAGEASTLTSVLSVQFLHGFCSVFSSGHSQQCWDICPGATPCQQAWPIEQASWEATRVSEWVVGGSWSRESSFPWWSSCSYFLIVECKGVSCSSTHHLTVMCFPDFLQSGFQYWFS